MGWILSSGNNKGRLEPLFVNADLVNTRRVNRKCDQGQFTRRDFGCHASSMASSTVRSGSAERITSKWMVGLGPQNLTTGLKYAPLTAPGSELDGELSK
jgi:hypothetical protein